MNAGHSEASQPAQHQPVRAGRASLLWIAALIPFLVLGFWRLRDGPGLTADDYGQYLMHAQALAEGRPYTDIGYIYSPFRWGTGPAAAPPGLPLTLAAIYKLLGPNIIVMRLVMLCFAAVFVLMAGWYFAHHQGRHIGLGVALLCALSPAIVHSSTQLLTDLPAAALLWIVIYLVDKPGRFSGARICAIAALGVLAVAFRVPAVALFPALALFAALRYRQHGLRAASPLLIWLTAGLLLLVVLPLEKLSAVRLDRLAQWSLSDGITNLKAYRLAVFESHSYPFPWPAANDGFHIVTGILMLIGIANWLRSSGAMFGPIFASVYFLMLLLLPLNQERYLWPLFPFLVFGLLNGIRVLIARWPVYSRRAGTLTLLAALALVPPAMARVIAQPRQENLMELTEVQTLVQTVRAASPPTSPRVIFYKPRSFAWTTGIPAMAAIGGSRECLIAEFARGRITHVILGSVAGGLNPVQQRDLAQLRRERPDILLPVLRTEHFVVYRTRLAEPEAVAASAACHRRDQG
jgi:hypothetical protein